MKNNNVMSWSISQAWNRGLETKPRKPVQARDHLWASEMGNAYIDTYLKMMGEEPTNPPNLRSQRKFEAGNFIEWVVGIVLLRAGVLVNKQEWLEYQYPGLISVTGKLDYLAGGVPDFTKAMSELKKFELPLPEFFGRAVEEVIKDLSKLPEKELRTLIFEIKSKSGMMFEKHLNMNVAQESHAIQAFHYLKAKDLHEAHVTYISRDDLRMHEIPVFNPGEVEAKYKKYIETMTHFYRAKEMPPKEDEIVFDDLFFKFSKNWRVEYSMYLTKLYGYSEPEAFDTRWKAEVAQFNRVYKRVVTGANMTKLNLEVIEKIKAYFPNFDELVDRGKEQLKNDPTIAAENGEETEA